MKPTIVKFIPALIWLIISFILLVLPGSDIPKATIFEIIYFDKWVHIGMFGLLTVLWGYPFLKAGTSSIKVFLQIAIAVLVYGISMEFVQKYFAYERSFDLMDILADAFGSAFGLLFLIRMFRKGRKAYTKNEPL